MNELHPIPDEILELVPESVVRECCVLPFELKGDTLSFYYPADLANTEQLAEKLCFILARPLGLCPLERARLCSAIEANYTRPSLSELESPIQNCDPGFRFVCPRKWHSLTSTADESVRHCPECNQQVYRYQSQAEMPTAHGKRCVFIQDLNMLGDVDSD